MITQGLILMLIGMSVVFSFLAIMVLLMQGSAIVCKRFDTVDAPTTNDDLAEIAVAIAAIKNKHV
ncbi:MAG: OadG family protein [bacterium]|nr:OadG family protein [bacterium]MBU1918948.1 OadG family protein [bacterium]